MEQSESDRKRKIVRESQIEKARARAIEKGSKKSELHVKKWKMCDDNKHIITMNVTNETP